MSIFKKKESPEKLIKEKTKKNDDRESVSENVSSKNGKSIFAKKSKSLKNPNKKTELEVKTSNNKKRERQSIGKIFFSGTRKNRKSANKPVSDTLISLDFGSREIKLVYGKVQGQKLKVQKLLSFEASEKWYKNGSIENPQQGQMVISEVLRKNGIATKNIVCTIESTNIIKREITIPKIDKADMDSLLYYEMGQYLPIDPKEYVIEYIEVEKFIVDNVEKVKLLVAVIPKGMVEGIFSFVSGMKLIPFAMDEHSNSLRKLIEFNEGYINQDYVLDKTIVLTDMGNEKTDIIVLKNGVYQFNIIIDFGYTDFKQIVSNGLGLKGEELFKKTSELLSETLNEYYNEIKSGRKSSSDMYENINHYFVRSLFTKTETFIGEIDRSLKYYTMQNDSNRIDKIYLYGGGALESDISRLMEDKLEIPTSYIEFMDCIDFAEGNNKDVSKYCNALGAMIRL